MEIRFSNIENVVRAGRVVKRKRPDLELPVTQIRNEILRFVVQNKDGSKADMQAHDDVIRALLTLDPDATVRTARAVYEGLADFESQAKARLP